MLKPHCNILLVSFHCFEFEMHKLLCQHGLRRYLNLTVDVLEFNENRKLTLVVCMHFHTHLSKRMMFCIRLVYVNEQQSSRILLVCFLVRPIPNSLIFLLLSMNAIVRQCIIRKIEVDYFSIMLCFLYL